MNKIKEILKVQMSKKARKSKSKYVFTLHGIDLMKIHMHYGINISCNIPTMNNIHPDNTTDLSSLSEVTCLKQKVSEKLTFLDESKRLRSCTLAYADFENSPRWCWWCKHMFDAPPWGCPLRIEASIIERKYTSAISKTSYTLREKEESDINKEIMYVTDGMFCSINCCKAWAVSNKKNNMYSQTPFLLHKMYNQVRGKSDDWIDLPPAAPDWRLLERFGGYLSIHQFRQDFDKIEYIPMGISETQIVVKFRPIARCFEEKLKF